MTKILIYNNNTAKVETFYRNLNDPMPYNTKNSLTVKEFKSNSNTEVLWTDLRTMQAWNSFRYIYGKPIFVGFAFKRIWEGGHSMYSQHYAGLAFDVGQNLDEQQRLEMRNLAYNSKIWSYVEPISETPRWVHFDNRWVAAGYPMLSQGKKGPYVCVLQDALMTLGYNTGGLDGNFGGNTRNSVRSYQQLKGLSVDGIVGPNTWNYLLKDVSGRIGNNK